MKLNRKNIKKYRGRFLQEIYLRFKILLYKKKYIRKLMSQFQQTKYPKKWVFIVGCYNSGSTLLQRLVSYHPEITTLPKEGVIFTDELIRPEEFGWTRMWAECQEKIELKPEKNPEKARQIVKDWCLLFNKKKDIYLEKSISNVPRMQWFDINFDSAYFIGIIRNGCPVCEGIRRRAKPGKNLNKFNTDVYPIELPCKQWKTANQVMFKQAEKVKKFHLVKYEELVADPVPTLTQLFNFIGIEQPEMKLENQILWIDGKSEYIQNMNEESIGRLSKKDLQKIYVAIGDNLEVYGYDDIVC